MDMMKNFNELSAEELFSFAQPEDFKKLGLGNSETEVTEVTEDEFVESIYLMDWELMEQEAAEHTAYVVQHGARAERRRRTRNKTASLRRCLIRIYRGYGTLEEPKVQEIIQKTSDKSLNNHHSEVNCWREDFKRAREADIRKENQQIKKTYIGLVDVEAV